MINAFLTWPAACAFAPKLALGVAAGVGVIMPGCGTPGIKLTLVLTGGTLALAGALGHFFSPVKVPILSGSAIPVSFQGVDYSCSNKKATVSY
jgi:hypothetical protein